MTVVFYVDPKIVNDRDQDPLNTITLSYTFYRLPEPRSRWRTPTVEADWKALNGDDDGRGSHQSSRLPPGRSEPVAGGRRHLGFHRGVRRHQLDAPSVRRGALVFGLGTIGILYTFIGWWRDVIREAQYEGFHTRVVQISHRYGMILFIASEVMFFVAWFWAYFNTALFPGDAHDYGRLAITHGVWPPQGIETFNPWHLPLLNTLILLTSGTTVTWAHHALLGERPAGTEMGPGADHPARPDLHLRAGLRIRARRVPLFAATSTAPPSSWRPVSTARTSSSARSS